MGFQGYPVSACFLCPPLRNADELETRHVEDENKKAELGGSLEMPFLSVGPVNSAGHAPRADHAKPQEFPFS